MPAGGPDLRFAYGMQCRALCCAGVGKAITLAQSTHPQQDITGICGCLDVAVGAITSGYYRIKLSPRTQIRKECAFLLPDAWYWIGALSQQKHDTKL